MGRLWLRIAVAALVLLPIPALADGVFIPQRVRPVAARIPAQRAIIVFRDGVETLTVESTLDAKGQAFGWIVPVPAKPTAVEKGTRGPLDVLDAATEPEIVHATGFAHDAPKWVFLFLSFLLLSRAALVRMGFDFRGLTVVGLIGFLLLPLPFAFRSLSEGGHGGGLNKGLSNARESIPGIHADPTRRVGAYDVTVLQADDAGALGKWLDANGFAALPAGGDTVVQAHVREGWSFVAVRFAKEGDGASAPHPLRIVFPAKEPIYPMRLTALAGGTTAVRLHVIAAEGRTGPGLKTITRGRISVRSSSAFGDGATGSLLHPRLLPDLWDGCVLTHLDGAFRPEDMGRDIVLAPTDSTAFRARYWSAEGARDTAAGYSLVTWTLLSLILLFVPPSYLPLRGKSGSPFLPCLLVLSAATGVAFLAIRASLPTIEVELRRAWDDDRYASDPFKTFLANDATRQGFAGKPDAAVTDVLRDRISIGDSPREAEVVSFPDRRIVRYYGEGGEPTDWPIPAAR